MPPSGILPHSDRSVLGLQARIFAGVRDAEASALGH